MEDIARDPGVEAILTVSGVGVSPPGFLIIQMGGFVAEVSLCQPLRNEHKPLLDLMFSGKFFCV